MKFLWSVHKVIHLFVFLILQTFVYTNSRNEVKIVSFDYVIAVGKTKTRGETNWSHTLGMTIATMVHLILSSLFADYYEK